MDIEIKFTELISADIFLKVERYIDFKLQNNF